MSKMHLITVIFWHRHKLTILLGRGDMIGQLQNASLAQNSFPQLDANYSENEKHKETQQQNVAQHRKGVEQKHHQNSHAWFWINIYNNQSNKDLH